MRDRRPLSVSAGGTHTLHWWLADAENHDLRPDRREVSDARWVTVQEIATLNRPSQVIGTSVLDGSCPLSSGSVGLPSDDHPLERTRFARRSP